MCQTQTVITDEEREKRRREIGELKSILLEEVGKRMILAGESFRLGEKIEREDGDEETMAAAGEPRVSMGDAMRQTALAFRIWLSTTPLDLQHKFRASFLFSHLPP